LEINPEDGNKPMSIIHWETISPTMREIMKAFGKSQIANHFYLAGGTALALQLGHRRSVDLDFFSPDLDIPSVVEPLRASLERYSPILADSAWENLVFVVGQVRVGFYGYSYPLLEPPTQAESIPLAGLTDIGLMKLDALLARASRKDFHDLYAICQRFPLQSLLDVAQMKFSHVRDFEAQAVRHLVYFERAEQEAPVPLIEEVSWERVKEFFQNQAKDLGTSWLS
jgi:hypothetical protein